MGLFFFGMILFVFRIPLRMFVGRWEFCRRNQAGVEEFPSYVGMTCINRRLKSLLLRSAELL